MKRIFCIAMVSSCLLALAPAWAGNLGTIDFPNSGSPEAQSAFVDGVLLLHSFEFEDSLEAFERAIEIDPDFAMAYWGAAMTHNHPLWRQKDREKALAVLGRLAPTPAERAAKAGTPRERAYLETLDILYAEGEKAEQDAAYERAMERMVRTYPEDLEARAFYALSILGTTQGTRDFSAYMRAAAEAEVVFAANPNHPGAVHYLIHSYDDPIHAPLGLRPASVYANIAPDATHAQHMISHIYIALGKWAEAGIANEKSLAVSEARAKRKGLPEDKRSHHALHWLQYSYLQEGRKEEAAELLATMAKDNQSALTSGTAWYLAHARALQGVETGDWTGALPSAPKVDKTSITAAAANGLVEAMQSLAKDDVKTARAALENLQAELGRRAERGASEGAEEGGMDMRRDTPRDLDVAAVVALEIEAQIARHDGQLATARTLLERATEIEDSLPLEFGPPEITKPSHELLGELLLEMDLPAEAQKQFSASLKLAPRRALSLQGLSTAARLAGDAEAAGAAAAELTRVRKQS
ncbi:MAG: hypothetical protein K8J08_09825 [Thermoanaerobaculia bacterium]|nr:hypothetical protein [Thermoanaerobaculia bacterium]